jgi:hypothetical protein
LRTEIELNEDVTNKENTGRFSTGSKAKFDKAERWELAKKNIKAIVRIQATWKGYAERKHLAQMLKYRSPGK